MRAVNVNCYSAFDVLVRVRLVRETLESVSSYMLLRAGTSTRPGEGAIYRYLSRQGKIAGDIHETKSSGLSLGDNPSDYPRGL